MKNLSQMLKQAQEMQSKMAEMQTALEQIEVTGQSGAGLVCRDCQRQGRGEEGEDRPQAGRIRTKSDVLEDLIVAAAKDAKTKADAQMAEQMSKLTGGLSLPPGFKLPF